MTNLQEVSEHISPYQGVAIRRTQDGIIELAAENGGSEHSVFLTDAQLEAIGRLIPQIMPVHTYKYK